MPLIIVAKILSGTGQITRNETQIERVMFLVGGLKNSFACFSQLLSKFHDAELVQ